MPYTNKRKEREGRYNSGGKSRRKKKTYGTWRWGSSMNRDGINHGLNMSKAPATKMYERTDSPCTSCCPASKIVCQFPNPSGGDLKFGKNVDDHS
jgi:hypothetical protein